MMVIWGAPSTVVVFAPATTGVGLAEYVDSGVLTKRVDVGIHASALSVEAVVVATNDAVVVALNEPATLVWFTEGAGVARVTFVAMIVVVGAVSPVVLFAAVVVGSNVVPLTRLVGMLSTVVPFASVVVVGTATTVAFSLSVGVATGGLTRVGEGNEMLPNAEVQAGGRSTVWLRRGTGPRTGAVALRRGEMMPVVLRRGTIPAGVAAAVLLLAVVVLLESVDVDASAVGLGVLTKLVDSTTVTVPDSVLMTTVELSIVDCNADTMPAMLTKGAVVAVALLAEDDESTLELAVGATIDEDEAGAASVAKVVSRGVVVLLEGDWVEEGDAVASAEDSLSALMDDRADSRTDSIDEMMLAMAESW